MRASLGMLILMAFGPPATQAQDQDPPPGAMLKVLDLVFKVENIAGEVSNLQVKETATEVRIELAADVLFDFDKATLQPAAEETLTKAAAIVRDKAVGAVRIEGHTDSMGNDAYNQRLSDRRAESVRQWLMRHGLGGLTLSARGYGE